MVGALKRWEVCLLETKHNLSVVIKSEEARIIPTERNFFQNPIISPLIFVFKKKKKLENFTFKNVMSIWKQLKIVLKGKC